MESILARVPSLMCSECEGRWLADWLQHWQFETCPNCGGELKPPLWVTDAIAARRSSAHGRA
jgi:hypothetical protein